VQPSSDVGSRPARVNAALALAARRDFPYSCDDRVGHLLAVLAATTRPRDRILELGTGCGVGTAWMISGLRDRTDVEVITVELDAALSTAAQELQWPSFVPFVVGDAVEVMPSMGRFDRIFADAVGGKWERLDLTVAALNGSGLLVVDDMTPSDDWSAEQSAQQAEVRIALLSHPALVSCELDWSTGLILATRHADTDTDTDTDESRR
jgi:demethylmenaquinone methyltransferase/2-methoxy-6-polyprenyl-1,4-benzoquinol methylase